RAHDLRLDREVAVKLLPAHFADNPKRLQRFEREVRAVAALRHPNIVPVFAAGTADGVPYFTMELVAGQALDRVIGALAGTGRSVEALRPDHWCRAIGAADDRTLPRTYLEAICRVVIDVADALHHAHEKRIVHRDVKPSNVMVEPNGHAKLFDFGLARLADDGRMTRTSEVVGSPHYMSPEQVEGGEIDHRSDVYSLGVTLYELLTLHVPFTGGSPEAIYRKIVHRDPARPSQHNPLLPRDLETICLTALEKQPARRYADAEEFAEDLRRFLRFEPVHARPLGRVTRTARFLRRNWATVSIALLALAVAITVPFLISANVEKREVMGDNSRLKLDIAAQQRQLEALRHDVQGAGAEVTSLRKQAQAAEEKLRKQREEMATAGAELQRKLAEVQQRSDESAALRGANQKLSVERATLQKSIRGQQTAIAEQEKQLGALNRSLQGREQELRSAEEKLQAAIRELGNSKQAHRVTTVNRLLMEAMTLRERDPGLGLLLVREAMERANPALPGHAPLQVRIDDILLELLQRSNEQLTLDDHQAVVSAVALSQLDALVATGTADGEVHTWSRDGARSASLRLGGSAVVGLEFVDERALLLARESGELLQWSGASDAAPRLLDGIVHHRGTPRHLSHDAVYVVGHNPTGGIAVVRRGTAQAPRVFGNGDDRPSGFAFSPAEPVLLAWEGKQVQVFELGTTRRIATLGLGAPVLSAAFDELGRQIASLLANGRVVVHNLADRTEVLRVPIDDGSPLGTGNVAFCAGNRHILVSAVGSTSHVLLRAGDGKIVARVRAETPLRGFALAPDGRVACVAGSGGSLVLLDTRRGRTVARLTGHRPLGFGTMRAVFSSDGGTVATIRGGTAARLWRARPGGALTLFGPQLGSTPEEFTGGRFETAPGHVRTVGPSGISRWHLRSGQRVAHLEQNPRSAPPESALSVDGARSVALGGGRIRVLDPRGQPLSLPLPVSEGGVVEHATCWADRIAAVCGEGPGRRTVRILGDPPVAPFVLPRGLPGGGMPVPAPDGNHFVVGYAELTLADLRYPDDFQRLPGAQRPCVFSSDSRWLAASTGFGIRVIDVATGRSQELDGPGSSARPTSMAFTRDASLLAIGWSTGTVLLYDWRHRPQHPIALGLHRGSVNRVVFGGAGQLLLSAGEDGVAVLSSRTGVRRLSFRAGGPLCDGDIARDGKSVLLIGADFGWIVPVEPQRLAAVEGARRLTAAERREFGL
ncbi:MAG: protein kinase, partial [Planctomycetes bacterium]|nr:protein kinase [Planctomycetota bacterium]